MILPVVAYMRCRFLAVESLSLTRNLVMAPERWLRDIGFHGVAPIIPGYVRDYPNSLGIQVDRPEVPSIGWHLTYARCKREKHGNKKYANAKRGIWTNVREIMVHFISRSPWEHSYDSWIYDSSFNNRFHHRRGHRLHLMRVLAFWHLPH